MEVVLPISYTAAIEKRSSDGRVYAEAENGTHLLRLRLYEAEQHLAGCSFVRISNGEIIHLESDTRIREYPGKKNEKKGVVLD